MKKNTKNKRKPVNDKYLIFVLMVAMIGVSWYTVLNGGKGDAKKMDMYIEKAQQHFSRGAYVTAVDCYLKALEIDENNYDLMLKTAESYRKCGDRNGFFEYCDMALENDRDNELAYLMKAEYYYDNGDYKDTIDVLNLVPVKSGKVQAMYDKVKYKYKTYSKTFEDTYGFYGAYASVQDDDGKWGLVDSEGNLRIPFKYDYVGGYNKLEDVVAVCKNDEWYLADLSGRKKYVSDKKYSFVGTFSHGLSPVCYEGRYGYMDINYNEYAMEFEYAGTFSSGVSTVCKDGKWALINTQFTNITDYIYDSIEVDGYGICEHDGKIKAYSDGKTVYLDASGNVIEAGPIYGCELTPYEKDGKWGYEDREGNAVTDPCYEDVSTVSKYGSMMVKTKDGWKVSRFYRFM